MRGLMNSTGLTEQLVAFVNSCHSTQALICQEKALKAEKNVNGRES